MGIELYYSSVSSNLEIKKHQQKMQMVLDSKKIEYVLHDIAADSSLKDKMRELMGDAKGLPPQLFNGSQYCGNYDAFEDAIECETLNQFLKL